MRPATRCRNPPRSERLYSFFPGLRIVEVWTEPDPDRPGDVRQRSGVVTRMHADGRLVWVRWDGNEEESSVFMGILEPEDSYGPGVCTLDGQPLATRSSWIKET